MRGAEPAPGNRGVGRRRGVVDARVERIALLLNIAHSPSPKVTAKPVCWNGAPLKVAMNSSDWPAAYCALVPTSAPSTFIVPLLTVAAELLDPVVGRVVAAGRESAGAVRYTPLALRRVGQRVQRRRVDAGAGEVAAGHRVVAGVGVIRRDVGRVGGDRHRRGEGRPPVPAARRRASQPRTFCLRRRRISDAGNRKSERWVGRTPNEERRATTNEERTRRGRPFFRPAPPHPLKIEQDLHRQVVA